VLDCAGLATSLLQCWVRLREECAASRPASRTQRQESQSSGGHPFVAIGPTPPARHQIAGHIPPRRCAHLNVAPRVHVGAPWGVDAYVIRFIRLVDCDRAGI